MARTFFAALAFVMLGISTASAQQLGHYVSSKESVPEDTTVCPTSDLVDSYVRAIVEDDDAAVQRAHACTRVGANRRAHVFFLKSGDSRNLKYDILEIKLWLSRGDLPELYLGTAYTIGAVEEKTLDEIVAEILSSLQQ